MCFLKGTCILGEGWATGVASKQLIAVGMII